MAEHEGSWVKAGVIIAAVSVLLSTGASVAVSAYSAREARDASTFERRYAALTMYRDSALRLSVALSAHALLIPDDAPHTLSDFPIEYQQAMGQTGEAIVDTLDEYRLSHLDAAYLMVDHWRFYECATDLGSESAAIVEKEAVPVPTTSRVYNTPQASLSVNKKDLEDLSADLQEYAVLLTALRDRPEVVDRSTISFCE